MRVLIQQGLSDPVATDDVDRVAIYDNDGDMLALMWRRDDGLIALTRAGEPDFTRLVSDMGLHKRARVQCVTA